VARIGEAGRIKVGGTVLQDVLITVTFTSSWRISVLGKDLGRVRLHHLVGCSRQFQADGLRLRHMEFLLHSFNSKTSTLLSSAPLRSQCCLVEHAFTAPTCSG
jgi:hypothetical protein